MPYMCAVFMCPTSKTKTRQNVSMFLFPESESMRKAWLDAIPTRKGFKLQKTTKICEFHFKDDDYYPRFGIHTRKMLKKNAVPSIFPKDEIFESHVSKILQVQNGCVVAKCESHLNGKVDLFSFPEIPDIKAEWIKVVAKSSLWKFNPKMKVCSQHFKASDFIRTTRTKGVRKLKKRAIPSIFPDEDPPDKKLTEDEQERLILEKEQEEKSKRYLEDIVSNFEKLTANYETRLNKTILKEFRARITNNFITFYRISFEDGVPTIKSTLTVTEDMKITITVDNQYVHPKSYCFPSYGEKLINFSQLENLLNAIAVDLKPQPLGSTTYNEQVSILKKAVDDMIEESDEYEDEDSNQLQKMLYNIQDIISVATSKKSHYSVDMWIQAAKLYCFTHSSYKLIRKLIRYPKEANVTRYIMVAESSHLQQKTKGS